ncbi:MAG: hypothetical protein JNL83_26590 [Myxococcales bacterium]|nr:hypothetical protein [Myxococcales bacterium]
MELVDIGINLTHRSFDRDRDEKALARATGRDELEIATATTKSSRRLLRLPGH